MTTDFAYLQLKIKNLNIESTLLVNERKEFLKGGKKNK